MTGPRGRLILLVAAMIILLGLIGCAESWKHDLSSRLDTVLESDGARVVEIHSSPDGPGQIQVDIEVDDAYALADIDPYRVLHELHQLDRDSESTIVFTSYRGEMARHTHYIWSPIDNELSCYTVEVERDASDQGGFLKMYATGITPEVIADVSSEATAVPLMILAQ